MAVKVSINDGLAFLLEDSLFSNGVVPSSAETKEEFGKCIITALRKCISFDKKNWQHKPQYRIAKIYADQFHDYETAKKEMSSIMILKPTVRGLTTIWKPENERPGKHFYYNKVYISFYVDLLDKTDDVFNLIQTVRKLRRLGSSMVYQVRAFDDAVAKMCVMIKNIVKIGPGFLGSCTTMFTYPQFLGYCKQYIEYVKNQKEFTNDEKLALIFLSDTGDCRRMANGFAATGIVDDCYHSLYMALFMKFVDKVKSENLKDGESTETNNPFIVQHPESIAAPVKASGTSTREKTRVARRDITPYAVQLLGAVHVLIENIRKDQANNVHLPFVVTKISGLTVADAISKDLSMSPSRRGGKTASSRELTPLSHSGKLERKIEVVMEDDLEVDEMANLFETKSKSKLSNSTTRDDEQDDDNDNEDDPATVSVKTEEKDDSAFIEDAEEDVNNSGASDIESEGSEGSSDDDQEEHEGDDGDDDDESDDGDDEDDDSQNNVNDDLTSKKRHAEAQENDLSPHKKAKLESTENPDDKEDTTSSDEENFVDANETMRSKTGNSNEDDSMEGSPAAQDNLETESNQSADSDDEMNDADDDNDDIVLLDYEDVEKEELMNIESIESGESEDETSHSAETEHTEDQLEKENDDEDNGDDEDGDGDGDGEQEDEEEDDEDDKDDEHEDLEIIDDNDEDDNAAKNHADSDDASASDSNDDIEETEGPLDHKSKQNSDWSSDDDGTKDENPDKRRKYNSIAPMSPVKLTEDHEESDTENKSEVGSDVDTSSGNKHDDINSTANDTPQKSPRSLRDRSRSRSLSIGYLERLKGNSSNSHRRTRSYAKNKTG
ncbi:unnamed protein product [Ambrosiozyma monospora]|uniref:Unnamed protein product n=1 Tax=Ambrosiozyma monospora TaxID=43982 RepID=A0ACB5SUS3_AMBMO|nr:unnamed protein product [Ambrosiozyma monospora]